jgi:hypothetical protein
MLNLTPEPLHALRSLKGEEGNLEPLNPEPLHALRSLKGEEGNPKP